MILDDLDRRTAVCIEQGAHLRLDIREGAALDRAECDGALPGREEVHRHLQRDGCGRDGEEGVEVGSSGLAAAEEPVEEAH